MAILVTLAKNRTFFCLIRGAHSLLVSVYLLINVCKRKSEQQHGLGRGAAVGAPRPATSEGACHDSEDQPTELPCRCPGGTLADSAKPRWPRQEEPQHAASLLDIHVHLFGPGDSRFRLPHVARGHRIAALPAPREIAAAAAKRAKTLDEGYVLALAEQLQQSGLQKGLILAQDAVYDRAGEPDWAKTHFYVPNDYLFQVVARYPQWMIPCVSINPDRKDALAELERCADKGARVLKIHPPIQGVDLADRKHTKFFQRCAALKTVVMVHTGHEHSAPIVDSALANPRKLELALDQGCTVVACHCGTGRPTIIRICCRISWPWRASTRTSGATPPCWAAWERSRDFLRLLADEPVRERLLHGSDFPLPAVPMAFAGTIGTAEALRLQALPNLIQRDFALKEALGIGRASAERAYRLLV